MLAPARSYSSVVSAMIGQHPELVGLPELKLFCFPTVGEMAAPLPFNIGASAASPIAAPGLVRALREYRVRRSDAEALSSTGSNWLKERSQNGLGPTSSTFFIERAFHPRTCGRKVAGERS